MGHEDTTSRIGRQLKPDRHTIKRYGAVTALNVVIVTVALVAPVAAQTTVGGGICDSPLATTLNEGSTLAVGILMAAGAVLTYLLHNYSGLKRDPQQVKEIKDWRNRAGFSTITTPVIAWAIVEFLGMTGVSLAGCINIIPF